MTNQERVLLLIGGAIVTHPDELKHQRESYAVTLVSKHIVGVTDEDKQVAVQKLMLLRMVSKEKLDNAHNVIMRSLSLAGFEMNAAAE